MATETRTEVKALAKSFGKNMESDLALEFLRVVENAAIAAAKTMGQGDRKILRQEHRIRPGVGVPAGGGERRH